MDKVCGPDYEAEYHRMIEMNTRLHEEKEKLMVKIDHLEAELIRLRAQVDIVYLIFGGGNRCADKEG